MRARKQVHSFSILFIGMSLNIREYRWHSLTSSIIVLSGYVARKPLGSSVANNLISGSSNDTYLYSGKDVLSNVDLPDCRGPVKVTIGYYFVNSNSLFFLCSFYHVESVYANLLQKSEFANLIQGYFDK